MTRYVAFAAALLAASVASAGVRLECPSELLSTEKVQSPSPWRVFVDQTNHPFDRLSLCDGPPDHRAILKPVNGDATAPEAWNWTLSETDNVYVVCHYLGTNAAYVQPLHKSVKRCSVALGSKAVECE